jgi:hypothetical protein
MLPPARRICGAQIGAPAGRFNIFESIYSDSINIGNAEVESLHQAPICGSQNPLRDAPRKPLGKEVCPTPQWEDNFDELARQEINYE